MKGPIVVLTGAGVSQESGIETFRAADGLWERHSIEDVASVEGFERDPELVHRFYNARRASLRAAEPNEAHHALAILERSCADFLLVTQNVDDLHQRAGSRKLIAMHGELRKARCTACGWVGVWEQDMGADSRCECGGQLRPHIVWFGEVPFGLEEAFAALRRCKLFLSIGTSGNVYPAAGFVSLVPREARRIECNAERTGISRAFTDWKVGPAGTTVPALVRELLEG
jgi:NAD-dependent deacetylase